MKETITIYLCDFVRSHLGQALTDDGLIDLNNHIKAYHPISPLLAEIIYNVTKNQHTCYIEFPTNTSLFREPRLWGWKDWIESAARDQRVKENAHKERVAYYIMEKNIGILARCIVSEWGWDWDAAKSAAYSWLKKNKKGAFRLVKAEKLLITKEEEL